MTDLDIQLASTVVTGNAFWQTTTRTVNAYQKTPRKPSRGALHSPRFPLIKQAGIDYESMVFQAQTSKSTWGVTSGGVLSNVLSARRWNATPVPGTTDYNSQTWASPGQIEIVNILGPVWDTDANAHGVYVGVPDAYGNYQYGRHRTQSGFNSLESDFPVSTQWAVPGGLHFRVGPSGLYAIGTPMDVGGRVRPGIGVELQPLMVKFGDGLNNAGTGFATRYMRAFRGTNFAAPWVYSRNTDRKLFPEVFNSCFTDPDAQVFVSGYVQVRNDLPAPNLTVTPRMSRTNPRGSNEFVSISPVAVPYYAVHTDGVRNRYWYAHTFTILGTSWPAPVEWEVFRSTPSDYVIETQYGAAPNISVDHATPTGRPTGYLTASSDELTEDGYYPGIAYPIGTMG